MFRKPNKNPQADLQSLIENKAFHDNSKGLLLV